MMSLCKGTSHQTSEFHHIVLGLHLGVTKDDNQQHVQLSQHCQTLVITLEIIYVKLFSLFLIYLYTILPCFPLRIHTVDCYFTKVNGSSQRGLSPENTGAFQSVAVCS